LEVEGLIRGQEFHELWQNFNSEESVFVNIEVSEGSWEIGGEVLGFGGSLKTFVGFKDF